SAALDWPRDKLHIQLLDDSTDGSRAIAAQIADELSLAGHDVRLLHRSDRAEYKAGALRAGMAASAHEYFAVLDVDYVPPVNFLRRCMAPLLADQRLAFVQARFDFLNAFDNALTETQMIALDAHVGVEQPMRSWAGLPLPFNGTAGIWRRRAIDECGGWRG